jgi:hypothetical protein
MDKWLRRIVFWTLFATFMGVIATLIEAHNIEAEYSTVSVPDSTVVAPKIRYAERSYILDDGTPCVILYGSTHSGIAGVTCNWNVKLPVLITTVRRVPNG